METVAMEWLLAAAVVAALVGPAAGGEGPNVLVRPADNGAVLCNPGMGWVLHYYDNSPSSYGGRLAPSDTVDDFPGLTVVYLRIGWGYIEPEEGRFQWSVLDAPAQRWVAKGKQIALRITCCESGGPATPDWVRKAGAKGYRFRAGKIDETGNAWEPDYGDPIFLEKLDHFLAALAARYDGNPEVAFIDIGSVGIWGEGHTYHSTKISIPPEVLKRHIDLHSKHFKKTLLAVNDDFSSHKDGQIAIDYARQQGLTLRDDSILVQGGNAAYYHAAMAQPFWPNVPVVLECEHYGSSKQAGNWQDGSMYLKALEEYHASYTSIHWWPREFLEANKDLIARMNRRLGYRLQLAEAAWPREVAAGGAIELATTWRNAGVAPCLPGGHPALTLKDSRGGIVAVLVDEGLDVRALPVGPPDKAETRTGKARLSLPLQLKTPGAYAVHVSVGTKTGTPRIALPLDGDDGQRRYKLGEVVVK